MEEKRFETYLIENNYKKSTAESYSKSIYLIEKDFSLYLYDLGKSLYFIRDSSILLNLYVQLYEVPAIIAQERTQRKRKSSAFKRYIEFRKLEEHDSENQNESQIDDIQESRTEGGKKVIISKVAERDLTLRKIAIKIHGTDCYGCGFNFENKYGSLGDKFIEIHHIKLLSNTEEIIITDPYTDLIPLCSNCHRMVHRKRNYVLSLEELKNAIIN